MIWNINKDLNWENKYTKIYPTGVVRIIEIATNLSLPAVIEGIFELTLRPMDPGIAVYKIAVDNGGYEYIYLKMRESPYNRK